MPKEKNQRNNLQIPIMQLIALCLAVAFLVSGCEEVKMADRYSTLYTLGEGISYRSFKFEVQKPTSDPWPESIGDRYAYVINQQSSHVLQITDAVFEGAKLFTEDFGAVKANGKWGYIRTLNYNDRTFEYVIKAVYDGAEPFSEGLAAVKVGNRYGYIDKKGIMVIKPAFLEAHFFHEGLAAVSDDGGWFFIDQTGNVIIPGPFGGAESFHYNRALIQFDGKWGYIDRTGQIILRPIYDNAWSFEYNGRAAVQMYKKWYYIDLIGNRL